MRIADRRPRLVEPDFTTVNRTLGDRAAFYLQPSYVIHSNTYSTAGCLEHIEHGHDIPGCADLATGIESNTLLVVSARRWPRSRAARRNDRDWFLGFNISRKFY